MGLVARFWRSCAPRRTSPEIRALGLEQQSRPLVVQALLDRDRLVNEGDRSRCPVVRSSLLHVENPLRLARDVGALGNRLSTYLGDWHEALGDWPEATPSFFSKRRRGGRSCRIPREKDSTRRTVASLRQCSRANCVGRWLITCTLTESGARVMMSANCVGAP
jgi:hypothetical protein